MRSRPRRLWSSTFALALGLCLALGQRTWAEVDPLASWNDGATKKAIVDFVHATTDQSSPRFVPPADRIATFDASGRPFLTKDPKLLLNDDHAGKPEGIHLMIGRRPHAAFGNSTGDRQMLEYTKAGDGARLSMLVLHDDARREYAYGPANGLPDTKVGTFSQALYDQAKTQGWIVVSMKNDWRRVFGFEGLANR